MNKLSTNIIFNMIALGLAGGLAILFNLLVTYFYGTEIFGLLNQVYAIFIILGQIGALGIQYSVQTHISSSNVEQEVRDIIQSGLFLVLIAAGILTAGFILFSDYLAWILDSSNLKTAILYAAPGLLFFCLNKIILGSLNGLLLMRSFATIQLLRAIIMVIAVWLLYMIKYPGSQLTIVFTISEFIVFLVGISILIWKGFVKSLELNRGWLVRNFKFGYESLFSGLLIELNTKIDILFLGYFLSDKVVGIYSLAATFAEGFSLILNVLRNNFNPLIAKILARADHAALKAMVDSWKPKIIVSVFALSLLALISYRVIIAYTGSEDWESSFPSFVVLLMGLVLTSGYFPFLATLMQAGKPIWYSLSIFVGISINILFCLILIPRIGLIGASISTSLASVISTGYIIWVTNRKVGAKVL